MSHDDAEQVATLLRLTRTDGAPAAIDPLRRARVRSAVEREWRGAVQGRRRRRKWTAALRSAACLTVILLITPYLQDYRSPLDALSSAAPPLPTAGTLERTAGRVELLLAPGVAPPDGGPRWLAAGEDLPAGALVATAMDGWALLRLASGVRLRLDRASVVRLYGGHACGLLAGTAYVETTGRQVEARWRPAFTVHTPMGAVRDTDPGTRFEVRLAEEGLVVRVREGEAEVRQERLAKGQELLLPAEGR